MKSLFHSVDKNRIISLLPRAISAAMLSSSLAVLLLTAIVPVYIGTFSIVAVMVLCAAVSVVLELTSFSRTVGIVVPSLCLVCGTALTLIPVGNGGSLLSAVMEQSSVSAQTVIGPCVCFCIVLCFVVRTVNRRFAWRCVAAGGLALFLLISILMKTELISAVLMVMLAYILVVVCQLFAPKGKDGQESWYVAVCLLVSFIAVILPAPNTRIPWERLVSIGASQTAFEQVGDFLGVDALDDGDSIKVTGFSSDAGRLGGWLNAFSKQEVVVSFSDGAYTDRITGSILSSYTGDEWVYTLSLTDMGYGLPDNTGGKYITMRKNSMVEDTVFYPPYTGTLTMSDGTGAHREENRMVFDEPGVLYSTAAFSDSAPVCSMSDAQRREYLSLPESLPPRVAELAHCITADKKGDRAKAEALLEALSRYRYDMQVPDVPSDSDFVDYFLFETREGYCVYFASAMAVMARCEGIPSRYVVGFRVPKSDASLIKLTGTNAHAWAELYINGKWEIYDPVPALIEEQEKQNAQVSETDTVSAMKKNLEALKKTLLIAYAVMAALAAAFFLLRPFVVRIKSRAALHRRYGDREGYDVLRRCQRLLWVLSACGVRRGSSETAEELSRRVSVECPWLDDKARDKMNGLLSQCGRILYSDGKSTGDAPKGAAWSVRRAYVKEYGILRYLRGWRKSVL